MADVEDLEYDGGVRHRISEAIDLKELREKGSCTFEVPDLNGAFDEDEDVLEKERESLVEGKKNFFKDISLKNMPVICRSTEDALGDYDEMQSTWKTIHEGVQKKCVRPSKSNDKVPDGAKVWIHFMAYHEFSDEPFDSSVQNRRPCTFRMGEGKVVPGLEIAVASMELKEMSKFLIQPEYAYGPLGCFERIPANARVVFTIELLEYSVVSKTNNIFEMTPEERSELPFTEIYKAAEELKRDGKQEWEHQEYQDSASLYSKAARILEEYFLTDDAQELEKNKMLYDLFNNLALCYLAMDKPKKAIKASKAAVQLPIDVKKDKPYYRMCKAYYMLGNMEEAKQMGDEALRICPNHSETLKLYSKVVNNMHAERQEEKVLFKKMMK